MAGGDIGKKPTPPDPVPVNNKTDNGDSMQNLITKAEACAYFKMSQTTFKTLKRWKAAHFPPARGARRNAPLFDLAELAAFFEEHAPQYADNAQRLDHPEA